MACFTKGRAVNERRKCGCPPQVGLTSAISLKVKCVQTMRSLVIGLARPEDSSTSEDKEAFWRANEILVLVDRVTHVLERSYFSRTAAEGRNL